MNTQEYISSGIVESYVLGLTSPEERSEFEQMCRQYPEVLKARNAFELAMEKQAMENAIAPPAGLKNKILADLSLSASAKIIPMQSTPVKNMNWLKYIAAACVRTGGSWTSARAMDTFCFIRKSKNSHLKKSSILS